MINVTEPGKLFGNHVQVRTISQKSYNCISMDHDFSKKNLPNIGEVNLLVKLMWNNCTSMDHFSKITDHCFSHKKTGFTQFFNNFCFFYLILVTCQYDSMYCKVCMAWIDFRLGRLVRLSQYGKLLRNKGTMYHFATEIMDDQTDFGLASLVRLSQDG